MSDQAPKFWELPPSKRKNKHKVDPRDWYPPHKWEEYKTHHLSLLSHLQDDGTWMFPRSMTVLNFDQKGKTYDLFTHDIKSGITNEYVRMDVPTAIRVFSDLGIVPTSLHIPYRYLRVAQNALFRIIPSEHPALKGKRWWYDTQPDGSVKISLIPDDNTP